MLIAVTTHAGSLQSEKCFGKINIFVVAKILFNEFWLMAIAALQRAMFAEKIKAGFCVIKIRFAGFPKDQCKIFAAVFFVAGHAILLLLADGKSVKAALLLDTIFDTRVAGLAFGIAQLFAEFVARRAKADAFQLAMALRQRPRRNLRVAY